MVRATRDVRVTSAASERRARVVGPLVRARGDRGAHQPELMRCVGKCDQVELWLYRHSKVRTFHMESYDGRVREASIC